MKNKKITIFLLLSLFFPATLFFSSCNKDEEDDEENAENKSYELVIENGAQNIEPGESINYTAVVVDSDGNFEEAENVTWEVEPDSLGSFSSNGVFNSSATGKAKITASFSVDGNTITASVPVGVYQPSFFAVAPSAILYESNHDIHLNTVYFGDENPNFSFSSSDESVATVNANGVVSLIASGECVITVEASTQPNRPFYVPVMVIGPPSVSLPITRIELNKYATDLFKDETEQLSATAYNAEGEVNDVSFTWTSDNTNIATVSSSGLITPERTGETTIHVNANGIQAHCEVIVNPDTLVIVSPLYKDMEQGETHQFNATAYELSRSGLGNTIDIDFSWFIPDYGPGFEMLDIASVDGDGNVTVKQDAMMGMSTVLIAYDPGNEYVAGGAMILVDIGMPY